jgi:Zn-dependent protease/CBS domain-containing protein
MPGSIRVARIFGIDINIHFSWIVIFFVIVTNLSESIYPDQFPQWSRQKTFVVSAVSALLFFASVVAHELAHSLVARRFQMTVSSITLFMLGGVASLTREPPSAKAELFMAAAGPLTSIVIGVAGVIIAFAADAALASAPWLQVVSAVAGYLGPINLIVAVFNLVPGFPLDGGRVLRAAIWAITKDRLAATRIAARGGQVFAGILFIVGVAFLFGIGFPQNELQGVLYGFIAYFLWNAASSSLQQERLASVVGGATVGPLMTTDFRSTPPGVMVGQVIRDLVLPMNLRAIPVVSGDRLLGLVAIGDLRKVEQDRWPTTAVEQVMTPASELATVSPDDPLGTALERFGATELPLLPVVKDGRLVGVLHREAVIGYVRMQEMLGLQGRRS